MTEHLPEPYLSVVVTTRNDDHGGDPLRRLQSFVNCFDAQCRRTGLDAEVIVVEWNPPADRPRLASLVRFPDPRACTYRFIDVPPALHRTLAAADRLPLFQMIAKNVGIRRARGRFVLATNIDILLTNELVEFLAERRLETGVMYRVDRHDVEAAIPIDAPLEEQMTFCAGHQLRLHTRWGTVPVDALGREVHASDDIVAGPGIALGRGWHMCEGTAAEGRYRWVKERATVRVDPAADARLNGAPAAVDIEVEPNPYDQASWIELEVVDGRGTQLARRRIVRPATLHVVLDPAIEARDIELRAIAPDDARRRLALFERRDAMLYRVRSIRMMPHVSDERRLPFVYPAAGWRLAPDGRLADTQPRDGLGVETALLRGAYCMAYGPLNAPRDGEYRFSLCCDVSEGAVSLGVLTGDLQSWIPSRQTDRVAADAYTIETSVSLKARQRFVLMVSNDHPTGVASTRCVVKDLRGSHDVSELLPMPAASLRWPPLLRDLRWSIAADRRSHETTS